MCIRDRAGVEGTVLSLVPPGKTFVVSKLCKSLGVPLRQMSIKGGKVLVGADAARGSKPPKARARRSASGGAPRAGAGNADAAKGESSGGAAKAQNAPVVGARDGDGAPREKVRRGYPKLAPGPTRNKAKAKAKSAGGRRPSFGG